MDDIVKNHTFIYADIYMIYSITYNTVHGVHNVHSIHIRTPQWMRERERERERDREQIISINSKYGELGYSI